MRIPNVSLRWLGAPAVLAAALYGTACDAVLGDFHLSSSGAGGSAQSTSSAGGASSSSSHTTTGSHTTSTTGSHTTSTTGSHTTSTTGAGGTGGHGGTGTTGTGMGGHAGTGGHGGGVVGDAGVLEPVAADLVSAGQRSQTGKYVMVSTVGQSTQNQEKATSQKYVMRGGLVGAIGSQP